MTQKGMGGRGSAEKRKNRKHREWGKTAERIWPCRCFFIFAAAAATPATAMGALSLVCGKHFLPVPVSKCHPPLLLTPFLPLPLLCLVVGSSKRFSHISPAVFGAFVVVCSWFMLSRRLANPFQNCSYSCTALNSFPLTPCQPVLHLVGNAKTELANRKSHKKCTCQSSSQR